MEEIKKQNEQESKKDIEISRRAAMTRMGLAAFSTATMLLLLNKPAKAQGEDTSTDPGDPIEW